MAMTAREVFIAVSNISKRTKNEYHFQAKLHGLEFKESTVDKVKFSKTDDEILTKQIERINKERFGK